MSITYIFGSLTKPFMRHHKFGNQKSAFQLCKAPIKFSIFQALSASLSLRLQGVLCIPIRPHPALVAIIADLARHHLHRHDDLYRCVTQVGQLGGHHWSFHQLHQCNGVRRLLFKAGWHIVHLCIRIDLALDFLE